jgi:hypothetical protein
VGCFVLNALLEIGADNGDEIVCRFFRRLGMPGHVVADVILHQFSHEAIDGSAGSGEALQHFRALFVIIQGPMNGFELADDFFGAVNQIDFFCGRV